MNELSEKEPYLTIKHWFMGMILRNKCNDDFEKMIEYAQNNQHEYKAMNEMTDKLIKFLDKYYILIERAEIENISKN